MLSDSFMCFGLAYLVWTIGVSELFVGRSDYELIPRFKDSILLNFLYILEGGSPSWERKIIVLSLVFRIGS